MIPLYERPEFQEPRISIKTVRKLSDPPLKCVKVRESKVGQAIRKKAIVHINRLKINQRVEFEGADITLTRVRSYLSAADSHRLKSSKGRRYYTVSEITPNLIIVWRMG
jgi:hypothetical protein